MIEALFDEKDGKCIGFLEWALVDEEGKPDNNGLYVYFSKLWTYKPNIGLAKELVKRVYDKSPAAIFAYWKRRKYKGRMKTILKHRLVKWLKEEKFNVRLN